MASKKLTHQVTLELTAGNAPVVDLGKMLGQTGINLVEVKKAYDAATAGQRGDIVPVVVSVFEDRSFALRLKTPPTSFLIKKALGDKGSSRPGHEVAGKLTTQQLREIAERKLPDLNTSDVEAAMRTIAGTARSMGVVVVD
ncbi:MULTISPECIES: 50S ribosomal protein L11 [unclassified Amycolatopsis]|uniref:50S ribosomal protein L11 n=1 Tax=unclassified Amycolatopsis TaxID=2618356 RepID=UPI0028744BF8|nr:MULTISPECIES: 50S ribosomal protein L11 [unclassified Amycolatopsis]MDS0133689.1 50S ribosomal protein L11 [Amycolatopsis sp. 505]MDS0148466.1 50S ribosomal protein L11 [Amycolatopsis sp. CM201R]